MNAKTHRLDKRGYSLVFKRGRIYRHQGFSIRVFKYQEKSESKVGYIIRKTCGNAVKRVFLRRQFRSCFVEAASNFKDSVAVVFEPQKEIKSIRRKTLRKSVFSILRTL